MLIRVRELELRNLEFDENYQPGAIEFGPDFRQIGPLAQRRPCRADRGASRAPPERGRHPAGGQGGGAPGVQLRALPGAGGRGRELGLRPDLPAVRAWIAAPMRWRLPRRRPRSGIIKAKVFCWKMRCASRCCWPRRSGRCAAKIARDYARIAARNLNVEQCHCEQHLSDPAVGCAERNQEEAAKLKVPIAGQCRAVLFTRS